MTAYRKDVYNLASGLGMAVDDPREGEARAREASMRADQELALRRTQAAQQQALAQREMSLSENNASFQQMLASQARGGPAGNVINAGLGQGGGGGAGPNVPSMMGRDDMNRQAYAAAHMQDILTGGQEARGRAANARNEPPGGVSVFGGGGRGPQGVQQAAWDRTGSILGDQSDLGVQSAIQALLGDKAKLGVEQQKVKNEANYQQGLLKGNRDQNAETSRHNAAQEALQRLGVLQGMSQTQVTQNTNDQNARRDLSAEAAARIPQILPEPGTGEITPATIQMLQQIQAQDPDLAREMAKQIATPDMDRRVGHDPDSQGFWGSGNEGGYRQMSGWGPITHASNVNNWIRWGADNRARYQQIADMGSPQMTSAKSRNYNPFAELLAQELAKNGLH